MHSRAMLQKTDNHKKMSARGFAGDIAGEHGLNAFAEKFLRNTGHVRSPTKSLSSLASSSQDQIWSKLSNSIIH